MYLVNYSIFRIDFADNLLFLFIANKSTVTGNAMFVTFGWSRFIMTLLHRTRKQWVNLLQAINNSMIKNLVKKPPTNIFFLFLFSFSSEYKHEELLHSSGYIYTTHCIHMHFGCYLFVNLFSKHLLKSYLSDCDFSLRKTAMYLNIRKK